MPCSFFFAMLELECRVLVVKRGHMNVRRSSRLIGLRPLRRRGSAGTSSSFCSRDEITMDMDVLTDKADKVLPRTK